MVEDGRANSGQGTKPVGLREGVPEELLSVRELQAFGGVEVALHGFLPGEMLVPPPKGHIVALHLSGSNRVAHRRDGATRTWTDVPGNVAIYPSGAPFEFSFGGRSEDVNVLLEEAFIGEVAGKVGVNPHKLEILGCFEARDPQMERLMLSFLSEIGSGGLGGGIYAESLATALAMHLLREHSSLGERAKRGVERGPKGGLSARALKAATDYVGDNLGRDLSLVGIAAAAGYSPHHFSRLFKRSTGLSPHQYVIRERVQKARELLADTDLSVGEVSRSVGFATQGHFAHQFKRLTGVTPREAAREYGGLMGNYAG